MIADALRRLLLSVFPLVESSSWTTGGDAWERRYGWRRACAFRRIQEQVWSYNHVEVRTEFGIRVLGTRLAAVVTDDLYGDDARGRQLSRECPCGHIGAMHRDRACQVVACRCAGWGQELPPVEPAPAASAVFETCKCNHSASYHTAAGGCLFPRLPSQPHHAAIKYCSCWAFEAASVTRSKGSGRPS